jgi:hypothetical protein
MKEGTFFMTVGGSSTVHVRARRVVRVALSLSLMAAFALALPAVSGAAILPAWGSNLRATPTLDTANGASSQTGDQPLSSYDPSASNLDQSISTSYNPGCQVSYYNTTINCTPWMHSGADNTVWNTSLASGSPAAPQGGQILEIKVKGCAVKDTSAPTNADGSQTSAGIPVNTILFQTLTEQSNGSFLTNNAATGFQLPFCSDSTAPTQGTVNTTTVNTYHPIHMCVKQGDYVDFYDIGGYIAHAPYSYYPQGVPFQVLAPVTGSGTDSFTDADVPNHQASGAPAVYYQGEQTGVNGNNNTGWGAEANQELMLQVSVQAVGDDAYGQCPGGYANEPTDSNHVNCVERHTSPGDPYGTCDASNNPVFPPANTGAPTIAGTATQNQRLEGSHGTWTNSPFGYAYQWTDCDGSGANCTPIAGKAATQSYYYPTAGDVGHTLVLQVSASNDANTIGPASSAPTGVVAASTLPPPPPPATGPPLITGLGLNPASFNSARGTTIVYNDSQTGTATFRIFALQPGVTRGRSCIAPPKKRPKGAKNCTRQVLVKKFTHADRGGQNGVKLTGVKPGKYVLQVTAKSAANGKTSQPVVVNFTSRLVHTTPHGARLASVWSGLSWLV